jgi:hypothetical protein
VAIQLPGADSAARTKAGLGRNSTALRRGTMDGSAGASKIQAEKKRKEAQAKKASSQRVRR